DKGNVQALDLATGREIAQYSSGHGTEHPIRFSADGSRMATWVVGDPKADIRVYRTPPAGKPPGFPLRTFKGSAVRADLSPDGRRLAVIPPDAPKTVKIWDVDEDRPPLVIEAESKNTLRVCFDRAGKRLATGGEDRVVRIWDAA